MKAYELLANPDSWIKNSFAKDKNGKRTTPSNPSAVKWCIVGAVSKCYGPEYLSIIHKLNSKQPNPIKWNDRRKTDYAMVIALLKKLDI